MGNRGLRAGAGAPHPRGSAVSEPAPLSAHLPAQVEPECARPGLSSGQPSQPGLEKPRPGLEQTDGPNAFRKPPFFSERTKLKDCEYPLISRILHGPCEKIARLFLMEADLAEEVPHDVSGAGAWEAAPEGLSGLQRSPWPQPSRTLSPGTTWLS